MSIRSRFPQRIWAVLAVVAAGCAFAQDPASFPLLKSCGEGAESVADVGGSDPVKIRYSFATDGGTCYAVTATVEGQAVSGYLASGTHWGNGPAHPAIVAFEQEIRAHAVEIPVAAPAAPAAAPAATPASPPAAAPAASKGTPPEAPAPVSFAGFRAIDVEGNRVDLSMKRATNIVVYFWSARDQKEVKKAEPMDALYDQFRRRGVDVVGIASAASAAQLRQICRDNEVLWSVILDSGGIANRYHVDPAKPYLLLDQSRKVIAAVGSPAELESVLRPLTARRKETQ